MARLFSALGVMARANPVDDDGWLVADDPGVVSARKRCDVARAGDELRAVVHPDRETSAHVILEVRRLAALGLGDRLYVVRPAPARFEDEAPDLASADVKNFGAPMRKVPGLVRLCAGSSDDVRLELHSLDRD